MKKMHLLYVVLSITFLIITSCGKYEEGPSFSLRYKSARITGTWKDVAINDSTHTNTSIMIFEIDGTCIFKDSYQNETYRGKWAFTDNKEGLIISIDFYLSGYNYTSRDTLMILRLTNSELWTKGNGANDTDIFKFEKL
jgi:hypothetical protein